MPVGYRLHGDRTTQFVGRVVASLSHLPFILSTVGHVVADTCWGNALIVVSLTQPPAIRPAPFGRAHWKRTEASAHPQLNPLPRCYGRGRTTHWPTSFGGWF